MDDFAILVSKVAAECHNLPAEKQEGDLADLLDILVLIGDISAELYQVAGCLYD